MSRAASRGHLTWRLRAADDLAALLRASGRAEEGRRLLAETLAAFEETGEYPIFRKVARPVAA